MLKIVYRKRPTKNEVQAFKDLLEVLRWYDENNKGYKIEYFIEEVLTLSHLKQYTIDEYIDIELDNTRQLICESIKEGNEELSEFYSTYYNRLCLLDHDYLKRYEKKYIKPVDIYEYANFGIDSIKVRLVKW